LIFSSFGQTLRAAGHRVRLATHEKFRKYVREHGLEFYPIASNPDDLMSFMVKNGGVFPSISSIIEGDLKSKRRDISNILQSTWFACIENDDETSAPFTAEVIIANPPSFGHVHCAQKLQIPLHMIFTMPWSSTTVFPHAFCKADYSKILKEKLNLISYDAIDTLVSSS
jgi:UDP:flavonoid glycosyltransferase YjiC (YdhE family)